MGPRSSARQHGRGGRLHGRNPYRGIQLFEPAACAADGSARADPGHEKVDSALGVAPDLLGGGAVVPRGVGGVLELLEDDRAGNLLTERLRPGDGPLHPLGAGGEDHLRAVGRHEPPALDAHRLGHGQNQPVALQGADQRQPDARISARGFDDRGTGTECAVGFGPLDHRQGDAVLHASRGIEQFDFRHDPRHSARIPAQTLQFDHRRIADKFQNGIHNFLHNFRFFLKNKKAADKRLPPNL